MWLFLSPSNTSLSAHDVLPQVISFRNVVLHTVVCVFKTVDKARLLSSDVLQVAALSSNSLVPLKLNHLKRVVTLHW